MVCYLCLSESCFVFNCYRHWSSLILWNGNGMSSFLHSMKGMTQGDPLAMVANGIDVILLIKLLKVRYLGATHPWYADCAGELDAYDNIVLYFISSKKFAPGRGYYPKTSKIVLILHPDNIETRELFGLRHGFNIQAYACYLGSFIKDKNSKRDWLQDCMLKWENNIRANR